MQEHFIPQDVSNYRFHLIGELDLKQFLEIIVGVVIAIIINQFNWPGFIKWPLMIFFGGFGLIAAFIPIADQPLSHWIGVFFKNLFQPNKFFWKKEVMVPAYFTYQPKSDVEQALNSQEAFNVTPAKKHKVIDFFSTLDQTNDEKDKLEIFEQERIQSALNSFALAPAPKVKIKPKKVLQKPSVQSEQSVRVRPIIIPSQENIDSFLNASSFFKPTQVTTKITGVDNQDHKLGWPQTPAQTAKLSQKLRTVAPPPPPSKQPEAPTVKGPETQSSLTQKTPSLMPNASLKTEIFTQEQNKPQKQEESPPLANSPATTPSPLNNPNKNLQPVNLNSDQKQAPPQAEKQSPSQNSTAQQPMRTLFLQGQVTDKENKPLAQAVISLKDSNRNLKFILRSDHLGKFKSSQELTPGRYILSTQKDLLLFPELFIDLDEQGIAPILLKPN